MIFFCGVQYRKVYGMHFRVTETPFISSEMDIGHHGIDTLWKVGRPWRLKARFTLLIDRQRSILPSSTETARKDRVPPSLQKASRCPNPIRKLHVRMWSAPVVSTHSALVVSVFQTHSVVSEDTPLGLREAPVQGGHRIRLLCNSTPNSHISGEVV